MCTVVHVHVCRVLAKALGVKPVHWNNAIFVLLSLWIRVLCCLSSFCRRLLLEVEIVTVTIATEMGTTTTSRRLWTESSHSMEQGSEVMQQCLRL